MTVLNPEGKAGPAGGVGPEGPAGGTFTPKATSIEGPAEAVLLTEVYEAIGLNSAALPAGTYEVHGFLTIIQEEVGPGATAIGYKNGVTQLGGTSSYSSPSGLNAVYQHYVQFRVTLALNDTIQIRAKKAGAGKFKVRPGESRISITRVE